MDDSNDFTKESDTQIQQDVEDIIDEGKKQDTPQSADEDDQKGTSKVVLVIVLVILAFAIFFGGSYFYNKYANRPDVVIERVTYNEFEFLFYNDLWNFQWQRGNDLFDIHLRFNPYDAETVTVIEVSPFNNFTTDKVYIAFDPLGNNSEYLPLAVGEFALSLKRVFGKDPIASCTRNETEPCHSREIITCDNTNESVVILQEINDTKVIIDDNCLTVQGSGLELLRAIDRVLYQWYGIINPQQ